MVPRKQILCSSHSYRDLFEFMTSEMILSEDRSVIIHKNRNIYRRLLKVLVVYFAVKYQMEIKHVSGLYTYDSLEPRLRILSAT